MLPSLSVASAVMVAQDKNMNHVPIGDLTLLAEEHDFHYSLFYLDGNNVLYQLVFPSQEGNITYNFIANYKGELNDFS